MAIVLALLVAMGPVCERLGGGHPALYNPANNGFVWATGSGTAREHIVRSVSCHRRPGGHGLIAARAAAGLCRRRAAPAVGDGCLHLLPCAALASAAHFALNAASMCAGGASLWGPGRRAAGTSAAAPRLDQVREGLGCTAWCGCRHIVDGGAVAGSGLTSPLPRSAAIVMYHGQATCSR